MNDNTPAAFLLSLLPALVFSTAAGAAGGHHGVDDAAILEPGRCELEGWTTRSRGSERLLHAGAGCRVGPVELGLAAEHARADGAGQSGYGLQAKWAREWRPGLSAGWSLSAGWQAQARPRYQGVTLAGLVTWAAREDLALHLNVGRDLVRGGPDQNRSGVSAEWAALPGWSLLGERYYEDRTHFARAGLRWAPSPDWTVDLSRAHRLSGPGASAWTLGASWQFGRP
jgi:hypothetical protein